MDDDLLSEVAQSATQQPRNTFLTAPRLPGDTSITVNAIVGVTRADRVPFWIQVKKVDGTLDETKKTYATGMVADDTTVSDIRYRGGVNEGNSINDVVIFGPSSYQMFDLRKFLRRIFTRTGELINDVIPLTAISPTTPDSNLRTDGEGNIVPGPLAEGELDPGPGLVIDGDGNLAIDPEYPRLLPDPTTGTPGETVILGDDTDGDGVPDNYEFGAPTSTSPVDPVNPPTEPDPQAIVPVARFDVADDVSNDHNLEFFYNAPTPGVAYFTISGGRGYSSSGGISLLNNTLMVGYGSGGSIMFGSVEASESGVEIESGNFTISSNILSALGGFTNSGHEIQTFKVIGTTAVRGGLYDPSDANAAKLLFGDAVDGGRGSSVAFNDTALGAGFAGFVVALALNSSTILGLCYNTLTANYSYRLWGWSGSGANAVITAPIEVVGIATASGANITISMSDNYLGVLLWASIPSNLTLFTVSGSGLATTFTFLNSFDTSAAALPAALGYINRSREFGISGSLIVFYSSSSSTWWLFAQIQSDGSLVFFTAPETPGTIRSLTLNSANSHVRYRYKIFGSILLAARGPVLSSGFASVGVNVAGANTTFEQTFISYTTPLSEPPDVALGFNDIFDFYADTVALMGAPSTGLQQYLVFGTLTGDASNLSVNLATTPIELVSRTDANQVSYMAINDNFLIYLSGGIWYGATLNRNGKDSTIGAPFVIDGLPTINILEINLTDRILVILTAVNSRSITVYDIVGSGVNTTFSLVGTRDLASTPPNITSPAFFAVVGDTFFIKPAELSNVFYVAEFGVANTFTPALVDDIPTGYNFSIHDDKYLIAPQTVPNKIIRGYRVQAYRQPVGGTASLIDTFDFNDNVSGGFHAENINGVEYLLDRILASLTSHQQVAFFHGQAQAASGQIIYLENQFGHIDTEFYFIVSLVTGDGPFGGDDPLVSDAIQSAAVKTNLIGSDSLLGRDSSSALFAITPANARLFTVQLFAFEPEITIDTTDYVSLINAGFNVRPGSQYIIELSGDVTSGTGSTGLNVYDIDITVAGNSITLGGPAHQDHVDLFGLQVREFTRRSSVQNVSVDNNQVIAVRAVAKKNAATTDTAIFNHIELKVINF